MNNGYEVIDRFLNDWKVNAKEFYLRVAAEYKEACVNTPSGSYIVNGIKFFHWQTRDNKFIEKYGKGTLQIIKHDMYRLDDILNKDVIAKKKKLISTVEKKAGKIIDVSELYIGVDGNINGSIKGELKTVSVNTIYAGGYNVQCLHYRILIK